MLNLNKQNELSLHNSNPFIIDIAKLPTFNSKTTFIFIKNMMRISLSKLADEYIYDLIFEVKCDCTFTNVDVITEVLLKRYSYDELRAATHEFVHLIGEGRLGMVYEVHI